MTNFTRNPAVDVKKQRWWFHRLPRTAICVPVVVISCHQPLLSWRLGSPAGTRSVKDYTWLYQQFVWMIITYCFWMVITYWSLSSAEYLEINKTWDQWGLWRLLIWWSEESCLMIYQVTSTLRMVYTRIEHSQNATQFVNQLPFWGVVAWAFSHKGICENFATRLSHEFVMDVVFGVLSDTVKVSMVLSLLYN